MSQRLRAVEPPLILAILVTAGVAVPSCGWTLFSATVAAAAIFWILRERGARYRRPEYLSVTALVLCEALFTLGILGSHGPRLLLVPLLSVPPLLFGAAWPTRGVVLATASTAALMVGADMAIDAHAVAATPPLVFYPVALLVSAVIVAAAAQGADVASRASASIDRVTGLLNRAALLSRAAELTHQSALTGEPVAVIVGDVDHFKLVNDEHGHAKGDAVLAGVAARLSAPLSGSSLASIYRFGGEEFVILAPGVDARAGTALAEQLRAALADAPVEGIRVTMSFGVSASRPGEKFDFEAAFGIADVALYSAKVEGRDRVRTAVSPTGGDTASSAPRGLPRPERRRGDRSAADPAEATATAASGDPEVPAGGSDEQGPVLADEHRAAPVAAGRLEERLAQERAFTGSWLVPDDAARAHMLDLLRRIRTMRLGAYGLVFVAILGAGPYYGWWPLLPPFLGSVVTGVVIDRSGEMRRPEFAIGGAIMLSLAANAGGFMLTHGHPLIALPMLAVSIWAWSPVFPARGVLIGSLFDAALIAGVTVHLAGGEVLSEPVVLAVPLLSLAVASLVGSALGQSALHHRGEAVVDQLTGMLTRQALEARVAELEHRIPQSGEHVAVIIADIDHFKQINDREGHRVGDVVLHEVGYRIRASLRAFEAVYRFGGEEFLVVLTGVRADQAAQVAERLRIAVGAEPIAGLRVTMSVGAAATDTAEGAFDYGALFDVADAELYEAKRSGRDRVCVAAHVSADGAEPSAPRAVPMPA